ncbi:MAG: HEAT repeat domain-containing protein [Planctomycetota bacterium]|jgi:hypothetical protein
MNIHASLIVAFVVLSSGVTRAAKTDCPRPDLWDRYPQIKKQVDNGLAEMKDYLAACEPEAFVARHPTLAKMARSPDWAQRVRALRAVAALEDPTGIPLLVAAIMDARDEKSLNEAMNPLTMWIATRSPRDRFKPLAPLFLNILVNAQDWPNVRCRCLQALGNLAGRDWLPIIRELLVSRHPAVTNMSDWVIQQVSSRPRTLAARDAIDLILGQNETRYRPSRKELAAIAGKIKRLIQSPPADREEDRVFYSSDIGWHDGWIPMSASLQDKPPDVGRFLRRWRYRDGRVHSVTVVEPGKPPWVEQRVWYGSRGAPILSFRRGPGNRARYCEWGDYDRGGLLRRVVKLNADYALMSVKVFDNGPKYCRTVIREFDARGRLRRITRYADNKVTCADVRRDEAPKVVNQGHRVDFICRMEDYGLAPFYPIGPGPMKVEPNDPPGSALRIMSVKVRPAGVEQQCRAEVVISNGGVGYRPPSGVICDSIMIRIFDSRGRLIFRAGHAWGGMEPWEPLCLNTDTHSNILRAAGGKPFLFPKPGRYTLSITACRGDSGKWTDSKSVTFHVGGDESEFKVLDGPRCRRCRTVRRHDRQLQGR